MIVVDAAAVVDALVMADGVEPLRERLAGDEMHAPALIDSEVVSALRGLTLANHLHPRRAVAALDDFEALTIRRWNATHELRRRMFDLRDNVSAYDAAYIALAEALPCPLVTRDRRLTRAAGHDAEIVVL